MLSIKSNKGESENKDICLMRNVNTPLEFALIKIEKVDYLNRENFKLLDKLLYISRKEGKLSRGSLKNKKYRHNTLNT